MGFHTHVLVNLGANIGKSSMWVISCRICVLVKFWAILWKRFNVGIGLPCFVLFKIRASLGKPSIWVNGLPYFCLGQILGKPLKTFDVGNGLPYSCLRQIGGQHREKLQCG